MIYLSGAISNDPNYKKKFELAELKLHESGFDEVFNPVTFLEENLTAEELKDWNKCMLTVLPELSKCDHMYLMDDWIDSYGACIEMIWANKLGIIIIREV